MNSFFKLTAGCVILLCLILTGCNKKNIEDDDSRVRLELYYYKQENQEGLKNIVKAFEKANPDVSIDMLIIPNDSDSVMTARAEQGRLSDILQMQSYSRIKEYAEKGYLLDLSKYGFINKLRKSSLPSVSYKGKQFAMPMDFSAIGIIYNKDIFEKFQIDPPESYAELKQVCEILKKNQVVPFAGMLRENWSAGQFLSMVHTSLLLEKNISPEKFFSDMNSGKISYGCVDTQKLFSILDFYGENMSSNADEMGTKEQICSFAKGESAMMVQGLWSYSEIKKNNPNINAGFVPFPVFDEKEKNKVYSDVDSTFAVSSQSSKEKKQAAIKFLEFLASEKGAKLWISEYKLSHSLENSDFSSLGQVYSDFESYAKKRGTLNWAFAQYPSQVYENSCKNGARDYLLKRKSSQDVIKEIDAQWGSVAR